MILLGAMFDRRAFDAHVVAVRSGDAPFIVRSADLANAGMHGVPYAVTFDDPQPSNAPNISWAVDGRAVMLESGGLPNDATTYLDPSAGGATTLHAFVGPPVNVQIDTSVFAYRSFLLGCARRPMPGSVIFSSDGTIVTDANRERADLFVRGIACGTPKRVATGLVAPLGLTFVPTRTFAEFAAISARAWRQSARSVFGFATYGTVLTRLRNGCTLKFFMQSGGRSFLDAPYAIAPIGGEFDDVRFLVTKTAPLTRRLPNAVRLPAATPRPASSDSVLDPQIAWHASPGT